MAPLPPQVSTGLSSSTPAPSFANQIAAADHKFNQEMYNIHAKIEPHVKAVEEQHPAFVAGKLLRAAFDKGYEHYKSWRDYFSASKPTSEQPIAVRPQSLQRARRRNDGPIDESTTSATQPSANSTAQASASSTPAPTNTTTKTTVTVTSNFTTPTLLPTISRDDFNLIKPHYDRLANLYKTSPFYSENPEIANFVDLYNHLNDNFKFGEPLLAERFAELNDAIEQINNVLTTTTTGGPRTTVDSDPWIDTFATYNDIIADYRMEGKNPEKNSAFSIFRAISFKINDHLTRGTGLTQQEIDAFNNAFFDFQNLPDIAPTLPPVATNSTINSTTASESSSSQRPTTTSTPSPTVSGKEARLYFNIFSNFNKSFISLGYNSGANYKLFNDLFIQAFSSDHVLTEANVADLNLSVTNIQKEHSPATTQAPELTPLSNKERNLLLDAIIKNDALIELYLRDHPDGVSQAFKDFQATHNELKNKLFPLEGEPREIYENESDKYVSQWGIAFNDEIIVRNGTTIINNISNGGLNAEGSVGVPLAAFIAGLATGTVATLCCCIKSRRSNRVAHVALERDRQTIYQDIEMNPPTRTPKRTEVRREIDASLAPQDLADQEFAAAQRALEAQQALEYLRNRSEGQDPNQALQQVEATRRAEANSRFRLAPSSASGGPQSLSGKFGNATTGAGRPTRRQAYDVASDAEQNPGDDYRSPILPMRTNPESVNPTARPARPKAEQANASATQAAGRGRGSVRREVNLKPQGLVGAPTRLPNPRSTGSAMTFLQPRGRGQGEDESET